MTKGDLDDVVPSHIKGSSKASPSKGKGLVKGRGGGKRSSSSKETKTSPIKTLTTDLTLNPVLKQSNLLASLKDSFSETKNLDLTEEKRGLKVEVSHGPFTVGRLFNLLQAPSGDIDDFCNKLKAELLSTEFVEKNNDLYQFHQTGDLLSSPDSAETPHLNAFKSILRGELKVMVEEVTGISLNDNIDLFCGKYARTDYLLCHDDELEGRRIAFIYYLVAPTWSSEDGGALDLFSTDANGQPEKVVKSLLPATNSFAFFPVSEKSFHQVAEVLSKDNVRLSLSGWFHADSPAARPPRFPPQLAPSFPWIPSASSDASSSSSPSSSSSLISDWISPMYFDANLSKTVNRKFGKKSEIQLENFILPENLSAVEKELRNCIATHAWRITGPSNKSRYDVCSSPSPSSTPELDKLVSVLRSEEFFFLLSHFTGLRIHPAMEYDDDEEGDEEDDESDSEAEEEEEEDEDGSKPAPSGGASKIPSGTGGDRGLDDVDDEEGPPVKRTKTQTEENTSSSLKLKLHVTPTEKDKEEKIGNEESCNDGEDNDDDDDDDDDDMEPPQCSIEIRRWQTGYYSLLGDMSSSAPSSSSSSASLRNLITGSELDVSLCIGVDAGWNSLRHGGATVYVAKDEEDELLSIAPKHNALSLVFREKDTASFVKYINCDAPGAFFQVACSFKEIPMEMEIEDVEGEEEKEEED